MIYTLYWLIIGIAVVYLHRNILQKEFGPDQFLVRSIGVVFLLLWPLVLTISILSFVVGIIIGKQNV